MIIAAERENRKRLRTVESRTPFLKKVDFLLLQTQDVAKGLTVIEYDMLQEINPVECISSSVRRTSNAIQQMINRFNTVSRWVSTEIVTTKTVKKRASVIKFFVEVAEARQSAHFKRCSHSFLVCL
jgi:uncharacterized protein YoxC